MYLELFHATRRRPHAAEERRHGWPGVRHFAFQVNDVDAKLAEIGGDAHVNLGPLEFNDFIPGWKTVWVRDPDGNVVEISQASIRRIRLPPPAAIEAKRSPPFKPRYPMTPAERLSVPDLAALELLRCAHGRRPAAGAQLLVESPRHAVRLAGFANFFGRRHVRRVRWTRRHRFLREFPLAYAVGTFALAAVLFAGGLQTHFVASAPFGLLRRYWRQLACWVLRRSQPRVPTWSAALGRKGGSWARLCRRPTPRPFSASSPASDCRSTCRTRSSSKADSTIPSPSFSLSR